MERDIFIVNKYIILILIMLLFVTGCSGNILLFSNDNIEGNLNQSLSKGNIFIEEGKDVTKDCTPEISIFCEGAQLICPLAEMEKSGQTG